MQKITDEQQLKINKLMRLKYKWHRRMMVWTWIFIVLYSVSVFFFLLHFHQVEYYLNWSLVLSLLIIFWIYLFAVWIFTAGNGMVWNSVDKLMISVWFIIVVVAVLICSIVWIFDGSFASIQYVFLAFLTYVLLYLKTKRVKI